MRFDTEQLRAVMHQSGGCVICCTDGPAACTCWNAPWKKGNERSERFQTGAGVLSCWPVLVRLVYQSVHTNLFRHKENKWQFQSKLLARLSLKNGASSYFTCQLSTWWTRPASLRAQKAITPSQIKMEESVLDLQTLGGRLRGASEGVLTRISIWVFLTFPLSLGSYKSNALCSWCLLFKLVTYIFLSPAPKSELVKLTPTFSPLLYNFALTGLHSTTPAARILSMSADVNP